MKLKFIIGEAGTAKTSALKRIQDNTLGDVVCLAFTHSAVNNMIEKGLKNVKTLHSFFKIMPNSTFINMPSECPDMLLIDEFSLINVELLESIFKNFENKNITIVCAGDILQLPPITDNDYINIKNIKLNGWCSLKYAQTVFNTLGRTIYGSSYFNKADKLILKKNFRNGTAVKSVLDEILKTKTVKCDTLNNTMKDYIYLASTYKNLRKMYENTHTFKTKGSGNVVVKTRIGPIEVENMNYILTENINESFFNGDIVKVSRVVDEGVYISKDNKECLIKVDEFGCYELLPENYLTVHYAQGRGFNNVCLCVDDLFEVGLLYTGITRARENIKLITFGGSLTVDVSDVVKPFLIIKENLYG